MSDVRDVLDRITVRYHLHPLSKPQTAAYLDFQVRTAGGTDAKGPLKERAFFMRTLIPAPPT